MPIDPVWLNHEAERLGVTWPNKGDRVRCRTRRRPASDLNDYEGTVDLVWLGIEVTINVETDDGVRLSVVPALGDTFEVIG